MAKYFKLKVNFLNQLTPPYEGRVSVSFCFDLNKLHHLQTKPTTKNQSNFVLKEPQVMNKIEKNSLTFKKTEWVVNYLA